MNPAIENFLARPKSHKIAFAVLSIAFFGYIFWQYSFKSVQEELTQVEDKITNLNTQLVTERRLAKNLTRYRTEVAELDAKLQVVLRELPDKREIPELLSTVSSLAREAGLEVSLFRPIPEQLRDFFAEVPVSIIVEGTYHQVASFFDEVARMARIVNIAGIAVNDPKANQDAVKVKTDCTVTTFRYLDDEERKMVEAEAEKKRAK